MRALVIGSGLIGLTTAHYLVQGGVTVTVLDAAAALQRPVQVTRTAG